MRKAQVVAKAAGATVAKRSRKPPLKSGESDKARARAIRRPRASRPPGSRVPVEPSISEAQTRVVAAKFTGGNGVSGKQATRPSLPASYGESHVLLLVRDPETLFVAWDVAPATIEALRARIGARGYAVSTLTLRLIHVGGAATEFHLGKRARTRYVKIDGGTSFMAEIGFTTPAGRFEPVARSARCFVPAGARARAELLGSGPRAVLGYREALDRVRRGLSPVPASNRVRARAIPALRDARASSATPSAVRILGGASDLYRR
jgi:hypothetical protein